MHESRGKGKRGKHDKVSEELKNVLREHFEKIRGPRQ